MQHIKVTKEWDESGYCRTYYRTLPNRQLICLQEESKDIAMWYTCIDDGCYFEPNFPIDMSKYYFEIVEKEDEHEQEDS